MKKTLLAILLGFLIAGCSSVTDPLIPRFPSRGTIVGTVRDYDTDSPVSGATVTLLPNSRVTTTDASGAFRLDSVASGKFTVTIGKAGYEEGSRALRVDSGVTSTMNFRLSTLPPAGQRMARLTVIDETTRAPISGAVLLIDDRPFDTSDARGDIVVTVPPNWTNAVIWKFGHTMRNVFTLFNEIGILRDTILIGQQASLVSSHYFSGTLADSSGNGHEGIAHGGSYAPDRFGNPESAFSFDGTADYISIPESPDFDFGSQTDFTICFWLNAGKQTNAQYASLISKALLSPAFQGYEFRINAFPFWPSFVIGTSKGESSMTLEDLLDSRWHFVTVSILRRSSEKQSSVDNGSRNSTQVAEVGGNVNAAAELRFGWNGVPGYYYKGLLDDVRIYRGGLTYQDISYLYHERGW